MFKLINKKINIFLGIMLSILLMVFSFFSFTLQNNKLLTSDELNQKNINSLTANGTAYIKQVDTNGFFSAAIVNDGKDKLYTWGQNDKGQLGLGDNEDYNSPQEVTFFSNSKFKEIKEVALGMSSGYAVANDGSQDLIYSWGSNSNGQLGLGNKDDQNTPQEVTALSGYNLIPQIAAGDLSAYALVHSGSRYDIYSWGSNEYGQLGIGTRESQEKPQKLSLFTDLKFKKIHSISAGNSHAGAIVEMREGSNYNLFFWGSNNSGQVGNGSSSDAVQIPSEVSIDDKWISMTQLSLGDDFSEALCDDGAGNDQVFTWGANSYGQLGTGDKTSHNTPYAVDGLGSSIKSIEAGGGSSTAITDDNQLYTWGQNDKGQLGLGNNDDQTTPVNVPFFKDSKFTSIDSNAIGKQHAMAIVEEGDQQSLYSWGSNSNGQLGDGTNDDKDTPKKTASTNDPSIINLSVDKDSLGDITFNSFSVKIDLKLDFWSIGGSTFDFSDYSINCLSDDEVISTVKNLKKFSDTYTFSGLEAATSYPNIKFELFRSQTSVKKTSVIFDEIKTLSNDCTVDNDSVIAEATSAEITFDIINPNPDYDLVAYKLLFQVSTDDFATTIDSEFLEGSKATTGSKLSVDGLDRGTNYSYRIINKNNSDEVLCDGAFETINISIADITEPKIVVDYYNASFTFDVISPIEGSPLQSYNIELQLEKDGTTSWDTMDSISGDSIQSGVNLKADSLDYQTTYNWQLVNTLNENQVLKSGSFKTLDALNVSITNPIIETEIYDSSFTFDIVISDESAPINSYNIELQLEKDGTSSWTTYDSVSGSQAQSDVNLKASSLLSDTSYNWQLVNTLHADEVLDSGSLVTQKVTECKIDNLTQEVMDKNFYVTFDIVYDDSGLMSPYNILLQVKKDGSSSWQDGSSFKPDSGVPGEYKGVSLSYENIEYNKDYKFQLVNTLDSKVLYDGTFVSAPDSTNAIVDNCNVGSITGTTALLTFDIISPYDDLELNDYSMQAQISLIDKDDWQDVGSSIEGNSVKKDQEIKIDNLETNTQYKYRIINTKVSTDQSLFEGEFLTSGDGINVSILNAVSTRIKYNQISVTFDLKYDNVKEDSKLLDFDIYLQYSIDGVSWKSSSEHYSTQYWKPTIKNPVKTNVVLNANNVPQLKKYQWRLVNTKNPSLDFQKGEIFMPLNPFYWFMLTFSIIFSIFLIGVIIFYTISRNLKLKREKDKN